MNKSRHLKLTVGAHFSYRLVVAVSLLLLCFQVYGHGGATGIVKERMDSMLSLKETMKSLRTMIIKDKAYDVSQLKRYASLIADESGKHLTEMFPEGSLYKPSEAKEELWQEWELFSTMAYDLEKLALQLGDTARATNSKDTKKLFKLIGDNCSDCHDKYRQ